jgi:PUA domain protein
VKIRKRYHFKKKKLKEMHETLGDYSKIIPVKATVEILETDNQDIILINGNPWIMLIDDIPFLTLKGALEVEITSQYVVVDMGVMSPGIVKTDPNIREGDFVIIVDETHHKPLAIGRSLISGEEMTRNTEGKAVKNLHYIGDEIWNLEI